MKTPKNKPPKNIKPVMRVTDREGVHHEIWGDDFVAFTLNDALTRLTALEEAEAKRNGAIQ